MTTVIYQHIVGFDRKTEKLAFKRLLYVGKSRSDQCYFDCVKLPPLAAKSLLFDDTVPSNLNYFLQVSEDRDVDCEIT